MESIIIMFPSLFARFSVLIDVIFLANASDIRDTFGVSAANEVTQNETAVTTVINPSKKCASVAALQIFSFFLFNRKR